MTPPRATKTHYGGNTMSDKPNTSAPKPRGGATRKPYKKPVIRSQEAFEKLALTSCGAEAGPNPIVCAEL